MITFLRHDSCFCMVCHLSGVFCSEKQRLKESEIADNMFWTSNIDTNYVHTDIQKFWLLVVQIEQKLPVSRQRDHQKVSELSITVSQTCTFDITYLTVSLFGLACLPREDNQLALVLFKPLNISLKGFCRPVFSPVVNWNTDGWSNFSWDACSLE